MNTENQTTIYDTSTTCFPSLHVFATQEFLDPKPVFMFSVILSGFLLYELVQAFSKHMKTFSFLKVGVL